MVELEHTRSLLEQMGLHTAAQLLDAQLEISLHSQQTYLPISPRTLILGTAAAPAKKSGNTLKAGKAAPTARDWKNSILRFSPVLTSARSKNWGLWPL